MSDCNSIIPVKSFVSNLGNRKFKSPSLFMNNVIKMNYLVTKNVCFLAIHTWKNIHNIIIIGVTPPVVFVGFENLKLSFKPGEQKSPTIISKNNVILR